MGTLFFPGKSNAISKRIKTDLKIDQTTENVDGQDAESDGDDAAGGQRTPQPRRSQLADVHRVDGALHSHAVTDQQSADENGGQTGPKSLEQPPGGRWEAGDDDGRLSTQLPGCGDGGQRPCDLADAQQGCEPWYIGFWGAKRVALLQGRYCDGWESQTESNVELSQI